ncbi:MAG: STAS domain-containing protein [Spirochaetes bacterium]|nr:STAS domain-containing protein [Spirochaetota bacterium]
MDDEITRLIHNDQQYIILEMPLHLFRDNVEDIVTTLTPEIQNGKFLVIDAAQCPYPSTEAIEVMLRMLKQFVAKKKGFRLPIANGNESWRKVFRIINITTLFQFYDSIAEAKAHYAE